MNALSNETMSSLHSSDGSADTLTEENDTNVVAINGGKKSRVKRTEADMLASVKGDPLSESMYVLNRVQKLEEKLAELIGSLSPEANDLFFRSPARSHLKRYNP